LNDASNPEALVRDADKEGPFPGSALSGGHSTEQRPKILVCVDYYLPGFKFGGPVRTLANMASRLSQYFDFYVFTKDRDEGDPQPYPDIALDEWTDVESAHVYYSKRHALRSFGCQLDRLQPDLIYLNSFFSRMTIKVLVARHFGRLRGFPVLLAPRGEFADGALAIKPLRKRVYIWLVNLFDLLHDVTLHASTEFEKTEIERWLKKSLRLTRAAPLVASDLPGTVTHTVVERLQRMPKEVGLLRAVFLARISRNKNLDGALRMLEGLKGRVQFTICGPVGDEQYWQECLAIIKRLPSNITVNVMGSVPHEKTAEVLSNHGLLLLPTHGENFGHSIVEALTVGCPVLISDRTPWRGLEKAGVGADIPLEQPERFTEFMQKMMALDNDEFLLWCVRARDYGVSLSQNPELLTQNVRLLEETIHHSRAGRHR
jgi:glycosyltransferase involved in cell wall biosynthesis